MMSRRSVSASSRSSTTPERVRLARARLAAEEGVPVEPAGVERGGDAGRERELADRRVARAPALDASHAPPRRARRAHGASWNGRPSRRARCPRRVAWRMHGIRVAAGRRRRRVEVGRSLAPARAPATCPSRARRRRLEHDVAAEPAARARAARPGARSAVPSIDVASGRIDSSMFRRGLAELGGPLVERGAHRSRPRVSSVGWCRTQRKPMWLMPVSTICGRRAAGR